MPLLEHERSKIIIADLIKILLNEMDITYEPYGSTTFKNRNMAQGIETDDCFYIKNADRMIGKTKVDLEIDPPPDLAIEVDVTSKTQLSVCQGLRVPELWRCENNKLRIDLWQNG
jgi:Uma2 family endonuclease